MDTSVKEVAFWAFCPECKYWKLKEEEEPCCDCLEVPFKEGTNKPEKFEAKSK